MAPARARRNHRLTFAPVKAKFVRIIQTDTVPDAPPWSMRLLPALSGTASGLRDGSF